MLKIAAVDDEKHALERFETVISSREDVELCGLFDDGDDFLAYIRKHPLDIVFLDIEMPEKTGLELAEEIMTVNPDILVVFATAFNQYAVEAFELNALDYILKPISKERLAKTFERIASRLRPAQKTNTRQVQDNSIYIQCFSSFEVLINGTAAPFSSAKARELLAFLVSRSGSAVSWEQITEALWYENDYEKAHNNLHATVYRLRKWLTEHGIPQILECKRNRYRIIPDQFDCDLYEFEKAELDGNRAKMQLLCKGRFMEENGYEWAYPKEAEIEIKIQKATE
jgi:two-component SAPR family response regulator